MIQCIWIELRKLLYVPYLVVTIFTSVFLMLLSTGATGENNENFTILSLLIHQPENLEMSIDQSALVLWSKGLGSWLFVFIPLVLTFAYIFNLSEERRNCQARFQLIRMSNRRYCQSKVISGILYGGCIFVIAYILFGVLLMCSFPSFFSFPIEEQQEYIKYIYGGSVTNYIVKRFIGVFLNGVEVSIYGIAVSVFFEDKYLLICLPFLISYLRGQMIMKLYMDVVAVQNEKQLAIIEALDSEYLLSINLNIYWFVHLMVVLLLYGILILAFEQKN
ncbi:hypothetical protein P261_00004 [Lachnospiraceae bacterium TWA4]|nr:hypothetical protein P261_00004 [Lachnospiraceae bacterium TWA4]